MQAVYAALGGMQKAEALLERTASHLARPPSFAAGGPQPQDEVSLSDEAVALLQANNDFNANLGPMKTVNEMRKTVLNVLA